MSNVAGMVERLRCPDCRRPGLSVVDGGQALRCSLCDRRFAMVDGRPILLRQDNAVFPPSAYLKAEQSSVAGAISRWARFVPDPSVNLASARCLAAMATRLAGPQDAFVLVVGGGGQRRWLDSRFKAFPNIHLIYCDVSRSALVDCYCDAHELPFVDGGFDGVITTAVLEHVLYPERAAAEIYRVLKAAGMLYSEIPFMQQVHEGAYDFTRYTLSGHRRLFNRFTEIESGMVAGPATALVWTIEYFVLSFFAGRRTRLIAKACARLAFFWIKYFDYLLQHKRQSLDAASCTYFLGCKQEQPVPDRQIIDDYVGATHAPRI